MCRCPNLLGLPGAAITVHLFQKVSSVPYIAMFVQFHKVIIAACSYVPNPPTKERLHIGKRLDKKIAQLQIDHILALLGNHGKTVSISLPNIEKHKRCTIIKLKSN